MATQLQVFEGIRGERKYQDKRWGTVKDHPHSVPEWILLMEKYLALAKAEWIDGRDDSALMEMLRATSLGVACMENHYVVEVNGADESYH